MKTFDLYNGFPLYFNCKLFRHSNKELLDEIQAQNQNRSISLSTIATIASLIVSGGALIKGAHELGVYVAKQVEARGIMSKEEYQSGPSIFTYANRIPALIPPLPAGITLNPILVGFDAYMMGVSD